MAKRANSDSIGWGVIRQGRGLWSRNAVKGEQVRDERLRRDGKIEWRSWNPRSSKLGAAIIRTSGDAEILLPKPGSNVLYIGAGHGTTISHLHDHVCGSGNHHAGSIVSVDLSARCIRDLISLAEKRPGILPVLADARQLDDYSIFLPNRVPWILQDVSQAGQVELMLKVCNRFLSQNGIALLSLKAASERWNDGGDEGRFSDAESKISDSQMKLVERIDLKGLEDQHVMYVLRPHWE
ncbi:MAG: fibrillarin-like rRNA/tRNA 2'-O-methyltransferase [Candidatus Thermoplasmatota archaeon]|nr:fibrillarin-like rRNA/tRNA 2'-O-methyltransferase [Candidatus Thermoplasmatota archaeon]